MKQQSIEVKTLMITMIFLKAHNLNTFTIAKSIHKHNFKIFKVVKF